MAKEDYVFLNHRYENAVMTIKAKLFDIISNEEKKAMLIGMAMGREGISEERQMALQELAIKQSEDLGRVITLTGKLSDSLARLDSYAKTLRELKLDKVSAAEVEKNVQESAAEVIVGINETNASQETKDQVIENVGIITETAQVTMPEIPVSQSTETITNVEGITPVPVAALSEDKVDALVVEETIPEAETKVEIVQEIPLGEPTEELVGFESLKQELAGGATKVEETVPEAETKVEIVQEIPLGEPTEELVGFESLKQELAGGVTKVEGVTPVEVKEVTPTEEVKTEDAAPVAAEAQPLIPVEAPVQEPAKVEETPAVVETQPLIPVETPVQEPAKVEETPAAVEDQPLIPVDTLVQEPAKVEDAPVAVETQPLIPVETPVQEETKTETTSATTTAIVEENLPEVADLEALVPIDITPVVEETTQVVETSITNDSITVDSPSDAAKALEVAATPEEISLSETQDVPKKEMFIKADKNNPRALLTSAKQITNLRKSLATQDALLGARLQLGTPDSTFNTSASFETQLVETGLLPADVDTMKKQVEQMMEQANALYKDNKVEEAQALYTKISEMNKQIQEKANNSLSV